MGRTRKREATQLKEPYPGFFSHIELETEPVWYLRALGHGAYLQTRHWAMRRRAFRESVPPVCELCGLDESQTGDWIRFNVHHRTYERLGYERHDDLVLLCSPCHHLVHYPDSRQARHWLEVRAFDAPDLAERALELVPPELS